MSEVSPSFCSGIVVALWVLLVLFLFRSPRQLGVSPRYRLQSLFYEMMQMEKLQNEARQIGWRVTRREMIWFFIFNLFLTCALSIITHNPFILLCGFGVGLYLPRFLLEKKR